MRKGNSEGHLIQSFCSLLFLSLTINSVVLITGYSSVWIPPTHIPHSLPTLQTPNATILSDDYPRVTSVATVIEPERLLCGSFKRHAAFDTVTFLHRKSRRMATTSRGNWVEAVQVGSSTTELWFNIVLVKSSQKRLSSKTLDGLFTSQGIAMRPSGKLLSW